MYGDLSMLDDTYVTIKKSEYDRLIDANKMLDKLYAAGVDNWEGFEFALDDYDEDED
jgi:uncharacterized protein YggE